MRKEARMKVEDVRRREQVIGRVEETRGEDGETEEGSARQPVASGVPPWETCS